MNWVQVFQIAIAILIAEIIDLSFAYVIRRVRTPHAGS